MSIQRLLGFFVATLATLADPTRFRICSEYGMRRVCSDIFAVTHQPGEGTAYGKWISLRILECIPNGQ